MEPRKSKRNVDNSSGSRKIKTLESVDRINALPDSILGVILSFLPTKNAVATSTLSKRWEFVWRTVPNLDFCLEVHWGRTVVQVEEENEKFVGFVNHVLLHHDAGILNKFCLVWTPNCIESHATSWIKSATTRNVYELSLTLQSYDEPFDMMPISCDSLQSLKLNGHICLSAATVFCLPKLESLDLYRVTFQSDEAFEKIIKGCPKLESLDLYRVNFQSDEAFEKIIKGCPLLHYLKIHMDEGEDEDEDELRFIISSTSLRRLELYLGGVSRHLKLEASSLEHLMIYNEGFVSMNFVPNNLSSLVEAKFVMYKDYDDDYFQAGICNSTVDAVSALDCVKILTLSEEVMRALSCATINLSTDFKRLVKLETRTYCCHWSSLRDFIQSSNNLEVLTIHQFAMCLDDGTEHDHSNWTTPVEVPRCLSTSLKKVVFHCYNGHEDEREMIRYMLKHGSVIEVIQISCYRDKIRKRFELLQEICEFPRKSPACEVKFSGWESKSKVKAL